LVTDHLSRWLFAPTPAAVANLRAEGIVDGVVEVGDVLQDLAARTAREVRDPAILTSVDMALIPGGYLFATIHRAENREPDAMTAWAALLNGVARPERPVILALHPGTRADLEAAAIELSPDVRVIEPQGYRTTLGLQLHAAAVLTDSGGVQREAAWLHVPCLILRGTTEWVEALASSGGTMVMVGLDAARATAELERLAPVSTGEADARARAADLRLEPAGAVDAIVAALG
ncbi:MAG: UDP-N-acetylglucosamine 2-epimerase, partial [Chloroflexota bacterium]